MKPTLAITMGDPRGIGPEVIVKAFPVLARDAHLRIFGHRHILAEAASLLGRSWGAHQSVIEPKISVSRKSTPKRCGEASLAYIKDAVAAVQAGDCDAIVTAPICKEHIKRAGSPYPGHTEMLAGFAGIKSKTYLMMVSKRLKVVLATLHIPLAQVPKLLNPSMLIESITLTHATLQERFKIRSPRIAVAGLNPHAGEQGVLGNEEQIIFLPAIQALKKKGIHAQGPYPGDTIFYRALRGEFDVVVSPYHDQGLIAIKLLDFEDAVNMTLGLPFIRTSVAHGVAFDIAWQGVANPKSLIAAGRLAAELVKGAL